MGTRSSSINIYTICPTETKVDGFYIVVLVLLQSTNTFARELIQTSSFLPLLLFMYVNRRERGSIQSPT